MERDYSLSRRAQLHTKLSASCLTEKKLSKIFKRYEKGSKGQAMHDSSISFQLNA
uniref:Uncharacterized protein n=1 Tax=Anguilla anguilla TaxID=7936 RepID=A0A0E9PXH1_ANGAN